MTFSSMAYLRYLRKFKRHMCINFNTNMSALAFCFKSTTQFCKAVGFSDSYSTAITCSYLSRQISNDCIVDRNINSIFVMCVCMLRRKNCREFKSSIVARKKRLKRTLIIGFPNDNVVKRTVLSKSCEWCSHLVHKCKRDNERYHNRKNEENNKNCNHNLNYVAQVAIWFNQKIKKLHLCREVLL